MQIEKGLRKKLESNLSAFFSLAQLFTTEIRIWIQSTHLRRGPEMKTASFIWYSHPERPMVNLSWDYDRETLDYYILEIDLDGSRLASNQVINYRGGLIQAGARIPVEMHWDDSDLYLNISGLVYHFRHRPSYVDLIESCQGKW